MQFLGVQFFRGTFFWGAVLRVQFLKPQGGQKLPPTKNHPKKQPLYITLIDSPDPKIESRILKEEKC